ncbi:MAG: hypothetical protein WD266_08465 [Balneolales bacterium]
MVTSCVNSFDDLTGSGPQQGNPTGEGAIEDDGDGDGEVDDEVNEVIAEDMSVQLNILPENSRYFQYRGLPMVLFGSQGTTGRGLIYTPYELNEERIREVAKHANHLYLTILPDNGNRNTGWDGLYSRLKTPHDQGEWQHLTNIARWARENDVIIHAFPWSYKWNYSEEDWTDSDFIYHRGSSEWDKVVTNGLTRLDLHELAIERIVAATWNYPNVVYNFMWEYNVRRHHGRDSDGSFHRWWVDRMKEEGRKINPELNHLFSIKYGKEHPGENNADFIVEEDGNGFWHNHSHSKVLGYQVPLVFISSDFPFSDNNFSGWNAIGYHPRVRENGQSQVHHITPGDVRAMVTEGFHPAETWQNATSNALDYYLQARWYMENIRSWNNEPGKLMENLPEYTPSARPELINPDGYQNGRNAGEYAAVYRHPDGLAPAQAEVWIDVNEDGRFDPAPENGERFVMEAQGSDVAGGATYTVTAPAGKHYVFRFADRNWNPPVSGGLVPGNAEGISYSHW